MVLSHMDCIWDERHEFPANDQTPLMNIWLTGSSNLTF